jgi:RND superfamily putative drug exporter
MSQPQSSVLPEASRDSQPPRARAPAVERIAGWSARHRKTAVFGWLALVAVAFTAAQLLGSPNHNLNDTGQSGRAEQTLERLGVYAPPSEGVLIRVRTPGATFASDPAMREAARQVTAALTALPHAAAGIRSPLGPSGKALVSQDGRSALITFTVPGNPNNEQQTVAPDLLAIAAIQGRHPGLRVAEAGDASLNRAVYAQIDADFGKALETSVPLTLILLVLVFGALVAAGIPVLLAVSSALTATWLLAIPGHWLPLGSLYSEVVLLIGMAVGVDYSLFYLRREREERANGASMAEAIATAARTSGRAIVVSGLTVMLALAGLFLTGYEQFTGIAIGAITVVAIAVGGSLTLLPALLSWLGPRADRSRIPVLGRRRTAAQPSRVWAGLARRVVRHPLLWGGAAALALLALAAPALQMHLEYPAIDAPANLPVVQTLDAIQTTFPQSPAPAEVVVTGRGLTGPAATSAVAALAARASATGPVREPVTAATVADGRALIVSVPLAGNGGDSASDGALATLRDRILPATLGTAHLSYAVAGDTASTYDNTQTLDTRTPLALGFVAVMAFFLLLAAFRSVVLPLVSIILNLLSVAAAYGLITLIFQDGRLQGPLGYTSSGAITPWVPLLLFVFLFGLSMDYHVFILSRIRELRDRGAATQDAITSGIASSAGVVTSAAIIMVAVFSIFATTHEIELKMLGIGLPAAVLIDATIVRGILLPAAMSLLGDRCWYLPRWLSWLPGRRPHQEA